MHLYCRTFLLRSGIFLSEHQSFVIIPSPADPAYSRLLLRQSTACNSYQTESDAEMDAAALYGPFFLLLATEERFSNGERIRGRLYIFQD